LRARSWFELSRYRQNKPQKDGVHIHDFRREKWTPLSFFLLLATSTGCQVVNYY